MIFASDAEALSCCRKWQEILRLQDWDVKVAVCRSRDFVVKEGQGECSWVLPAKRAVIKLLDPVDYPEVRWEQDHERTLVHELLHLHMVPFKPDSDTLENDMMEQAICAISEALIRGG